MNQEGCEHYKRNCAIKAPCCDKFYTCRNCHDENEEHEMNRYDVKTIRCLICGTIQNLSNKCMLCMTKFGKYHCDKCKFFLNDDIDIYHCDKCNICRIGKGLGIDYYHCDECNVCFSMDGKNKHKCKKDVLHVNCPICFEYLFTSRSSVSFLPCYHAIHTKCLNLFVSNGNYKCPLCMKSVGDMSMHFSKLDEQIKNNPMTNPKKVNILCNDCISKSNTSYHDYGNKCLNCGSYNTRII